MSGVQLWNRERHRAGAADKEGTTNRTIRVATHLHRVPCSTALRRPSAEEDVKGGSFDSLVPTEMVPTRRRKSEVPITYDPAGRDV
jgi:hypothetical protein